MKVPNMEEILKRIRNDEQLFSKIDGKIHYKCEQLNNINQQQLVSSIPNHIWNCLPRYLNENIRMKRILDGQIENVKDELESRMDNIITNLIHDENYHKINKIYFDKFKSDGEKEIKEMQKRANRTTLLFREEMNKIDNIQKISRKNNVMCGFFGIISVVSLGITLYEKYY